MTALDWSIVVAFALYAVSNGLRARRAASRNLEEYFLAGRSLRGWQAGVSMAATQFAADTPLLVTGLIATAGVFSLWRLWCAQVSEQNPHARRLFVVVIVSADIFHAGDDIRLPAPCQVAWLHAARLMDRITCQRNAQRAMPDLPV